jgi:hypothetical protein
MGITGIAVLCLALSTCYRFTTEDWNGSALLPPFDLLGDAAEQELQWKAAAERVNQRLEKKTAIIRDVIAGRLKLLEAAARYRKLNADFPHASHWLEQQRYPGMPYERALCQQIIDTVRDELSEAAPDQVKPLVSRLEAELKEHLCADGQVHLP